MGKQPTTGQKKTKEQIAKAAQSSSAHGGKKKWTKGKVKDKIERAVFVDKAGYDKVLSEIVKMKLITVATMVDKFKINGSLARRFIRTAAEQKLIKPVGEQDSSLFLYTTAQDKPAATATTTTQQSQKAEKGQKKQDK